MKAEFIETTNQIKIKEFPYFLYSEAPFFKILNILKDDFYIAIRKSQKKESTESKDESKNTNEEEDIKFIDLTFTAKEQLNKEEAEEIFKEIMNSLVSFEKGSSLLSLEPSPEAECN